MHILYDLKTMGYRYVGIKTINYILRGIYLYLSSWQNFTLYSYLPSPHPFLPAYIFKKHTLISNLRKLVQACFISVRARANKSILPFLPTGQRAIHFLILAFSQYTKHEREAELANGRTEMVQRENEARFSFVRKMDQSDVSEISSIEAKELTEGMSVLKNLKKDRDTKISIASIVEFSMIWIVGRIACSCFINDYYTHVYFLYKF